MLLKFFVSVFFMFFTSLSASADTSLNSKGPYLVVDSGKVTISKINKDGTVEVSRYDSAGSKAAIQKIEDELAIQSIDKGSFHTSSNEAIVDWVSLHDGFTYGTMFGPPGEELFVIETFKFKGRGNPDYESFKRLCDKVSFVPAGR